MEGNCRIVRNDLDTSIASRRKQYEKKWILRLSIAYHYDLNDQLGDENNKRDEMYAYSYSYCVVETQQFFS